MDAPFAAIDELISSSTMGLLADLVITRADGKQFLARSSFQDRSLFDKYAVAEDLYIEYREADAPAVTAGEHVTLDGATYRVSGDPLWINRQEKRAQLVEVD